jgi:hypothetical protein
LLAKVSAVAIAFAIVAAWWPRVVAYPLGVLAAWVGIAWLAKAIRVRNQRAKPKLWFPPSRQSRARVAASGLGIDYNRGSRP